MQPFAVQVDISAKHGLISITEEGRERSSNETLHSFVRVSGTSWQVNAALLSMKYISSHNWHGWDKIQVVITDLGYEGLEATSEAQSYDIHLSVAAINDPPIIGVDGFNVTLVLDTQSTAANPTASAFLVSAMEDTVTVVTGVRVWDVDIPEEGGILSRPGEFLIATNSNGAGNGLGRLALNPKIRLSVTCTYGQISLGGGHAGLVAEEGDLDTGERVLIVVGSLSHINEALSEGIIYTPQQNWSGLDVVEVRVSTSESPMKAP